MTNYLEHIKIAKDFWTSKKTYPEYGTIKQRRLHELNYLVPKLKGKTILDLGCGDGALANCLINLIDFEKFYAYDWSESLIENLNPQIIKQVYDCNNPQTLPKVDVIIFAGVVPFIFDDEKLLSLFNYFDANEIFIRAPCTEKNEREIVKTYSEHLKENYASVYRTVSELSKLINKKFNLLNVTRVYPDDIESNFGTKQYYFHALKN